MLWRKTRPGRVIKRFLVGWGAGGGRGPFIQVVRESLIRQHLNRDPKDGGQPDSPLQPAQLRGHETCAVTPGLRSAGSPAWSNVLLSLCSDA